MDGTSVCNARCIRCSYWLCGVLFGLGPRGGGWQLGRVAQWGSEVFVLGVFCGQEVAYGILVGIDRTKGANKVHTSTVEGELRVATFLELTFFPRLVPAV